MGERETSHLHRCLVRMLADRYRYDLDHTRGQSLAEYGPVEFSYVSKEEEKVFGRERRAVYDKTLVTTDPTPREELQQQRDPQPVNASNTPANVSYSMSHANESTTPLPSLPITIGTVKQVTSTTQQPPSEVSSPVNTPTKDSVRIHRSRSPTFFRSPSLRNRNDRNPSECLPGQARLRSKRCTVHGARCTPYIESSYRRL